MPLVKPQEPRRRVPTDQISGSDIADTTHWRYRPVPSYESRRQWTSTKLVTHTRPTVNSSDPQIVHSPLDAIAYKRSRSNCFFFSTRASWVYTPRARSVNPALIRTRD